MAFGGIHPFMLKSGGGGGGGGGGDLFSVAPCAGGSNVLCSDDSSLTPEVDDVVQYEDAVDTYCGTVTATGQGGSAAADIIDTGFADCDECNEILGGGGE